MAQVKEVKGPGPRGMGGPKPKVENPGKLLKRIMDEVFKHYLPHCILVLVCIIVSALANVQASLFLKTLIDDYIVPMTKQATPDFGPLAGALVRIGCIYAIGVLAAWLNARIMVNVTQGTLRNLRVQLFTHMESLPIRYFDSHPHGDIMSVYTNDVDTLRQMISQSIPQLVSSAITIVSVFISMCLMSWQLTVVTMLMVALMLFCSKKITSMSGKYFVAQQKDLGKVNGYIEEMMEGQKVVKVFTHEQKTLDGFRALNNKLKDSAKQANSYANNIMPVTAQLGNISYAVCALVGAAMAVGNVGGMTLGTVMAFLSLNKSFNISQTLEGKLPQRKIVTTAAAGYSSYGNQIGLATGIVDEIYHPGYAAKRMEIGAVIAAAPAENVRRECPCPGDIVILLGGRTGRDGCGGATGSSKSHTVASLESCGAEVQKGNAPEERKLQRLFRNPQAARMIKRCNDFGAGGVSVAIGELADGLDIDLNSVPKKYDGLDGTELAISESQERMAVVVAPEDAAAFIEIAGKENLEATIVAKVTAEPRLKMRWNGRTIVDVSREFLNSNGAEKHITIKTAKPDSFEKPIPADFSAGHSALMSDLNVCSKRGLSERFDSTIGAGTVLMPFGGRYQQTPVQAMVQKISVEKAHTDDCSFMSWGYNPYITEASPYHGAYLAVVESVSKLIASGASFRDVYLTFQEYFARPGKDTARWGQPMSALLGAFRAQKELGVAAIGGKDSMSGSFEKLDVPPTLVSFAVTTGKVGEVVSPEFKNPGSEVILITPEYDENGLPVTSSLLEVFSRVTSLLRSGKAVSCYTPCLGGVAEAVFKMCIGNRLGFEYDKSLTLDEMFGYAYGGFILELAAGVRAEEGRRLGRVTDIPSVSWRGESLELSAMQNAYENRLEGVYSCNIPTEGKKIENYSCTVRYGASPAVKCAKPRVLIPVFPGTNCEYDSAKAVGDAGAEAEIYVINNLSSDGISRSVEEFARLVRASQIVFIPGGFSGGDEPDGSGKFITAFFRSAAVREAVGELLDVRGGLMCGICNGFQALIKLGLVPYGKIIDTDAHCPTLTFNTIGRHQSKIVRTRVTSVKSPWLSGCEVGEIYSVPISHGEGRFIAEENVLRQLAANGQIATQYVDLDGNATDDIHFNPNNSMAAVEGILSPDGRVFGKMGHSERTGDGLYKNVPGKYDMKLFESAVKYFR